MPNILILKAFSHGSNLVINNTMQPITYIKGDALNPQSKENVIIAHICNDIGKWGKGFVMAISKKWKSPREEYINWYNSNTLSLGKVQYVKVENNIYIANMIAQKGIYSSNNPIPIQYNHLQECLNNIKTYATLKEATVHMPRIGTGLAKGSWKVIEKLIINSLCNHNIKVYVYDL